jgi:para-nitrobenzyl esterase
MTNKTMIALAICLFIFDANAAPVAVHSQSGDLEGVPLAAGGGVFKGIPYAAAPTGAKRWQSPQPVAAWQGVRKATVYGAACEQPAQGWNDSLIASMSEDCLYLNVWTPALHPKAPSPVMVWIHGGAFVGGAGTDPVFDGEELVKKGVILVTLNYRLGVFGFYAHPDITRDSAHHSSGNFALEDQMAALQWVHDNIAAFGGDAGKITVFGQSAGGMSVITLLASPLMKGKIQRAIVESGTILGGPPMRQLKDAEVTGAAFAGTDGLQSLREMSAPELLKRFGAFISTHREVRPGPVVDGYVLSTDPSDAFKLGQEDLVPLIVGNNAREGFGRLSDEALPGAIKQFYGADAAAALPLYAALDPVLGNPAAQWLTDTSFRCSAVLTAARHAAGGAPVYSYQFEQSLPGREGEGAAHSYELPYVFGNLLPNGALAGPFSAADRQLSDTMLAYWTNFAKRGDPNGTGLPSWPKFIATSGSYMRFASALPQNAQPGEGLRRAQCRLFEAKLEKDEPAKFRQVTVETAVSGTLRPFNGATGAPGAEFAGNRDEAKIDVSQAYKRARIDLIRTHDAFGPGDIDAQFGVHQNLPMSIPAERNALNIFPDMNADADNPKSYNFAPTDRLIASIEGVGAQTIFRIGRSIGADPTPPADLNKYAQIARHIVLHYNRGWNDGFHYGLRYWEVWNEPDFRVFWTGAPQQYYELYEKVARAVKTADPEALVGGPTISKPLDATPYREGFLAFVRERKLPLDFFAWHYYTMDSNDPQTLVDIGKRIRSILDSYGFRSTKNVVDEWNVDLFDRDLSKTARAAFALTSLIYMLNAPIDLQAYYRADPSFRTADAKPDAVGNALTAFGMMKDTPILLKSTGGDDAGFAVLAGRSKDGRTIQVLLSNYQIAAKSLGPRANGDVLHIPDIMDITLPPRRSLTYHDNAGYDLGLDVPAGSYQVTRYRITDTEHFTQVDQSSQSGPKLRLSAALPAPGIEFIKIVLQ